MQEAVRTLIMRVRWGSRPHVDGSNNELRRINSIKLGFSYDGEAKNSQNNYALFSVIS